MEWKLRDRITLSKKYSSGEQMLQVEQDNCISEEHKAAQTVLTYAATQYSDI